MRIALIADFHGNWPAVEALEKDLKRRRVDRIYCLGDLVGKGPSSVQTCDWARANCDLILGGNWDYGVGGKQFARDDRYWDALGPERLRFLRELPREHTLTLSGQRVRLFHGRPVMKDLLTAHSPESELRPFLINEEGEACDVIGYADAHRQALRTLTPGLIFNCGSVGNGLGNPRVCYAILEGSESDPCAPLDVLLCSLPYDRERAIADAQDAPEIPRIDTYIREVQTGLYSRQNLGGSI